MKCIIVDDEPLAREGMELNVQEVPFLECVGTFPSALDANEFLHNNQVDLVFLDIQMPGITGLDFIRILKDKPMFILTTAYPEFALESYELDVVDYLVKPIRLERFLKAVNKAKDLYLLQEKSENNSPQVNNEDGFIYLKSDRKILKVFLKDIRFISGMKDYVMVHTNKDRIMTAMNLKTIFEQLPQDQFARVSKSHLINVHYLESMDGDEINLGNDKIPLGKTYRDDFINRFIKDNLLERP
ncbi:MAG: response regulator transcription factor [Saprospiraceae bacterium]|nr:response regulator transcription factor [Saprospiraceae bacterium]